MVVVRSGGTVELPWREDVAAVLEQWYPEQADGDAAAAVHYGDRDPSVRLPVTLAPADEYATAGAEGRCPGVDVEVHAMRTTLRLPTLRRRRRRPDLSVGHGHSYATFEYGDAEIAASGRSQFRKNAADRPGRDVIQAYVRPPSVDGVDRPRRELAGFEAVQLDLMNRDGRLSRSTWRSRATTRIPAGRSTP